MNLYAIWIRRLCASTILLFSFIKGDDQVQTDVYPPYQVSTIDKRISGIWRLDVRTDSTLSIRAWTETEQKLIDTGCSSWTLNLQIHQDSPLLPSELLKNATEILYPEGVAWFAKSLYLDPMSVGSNATNEQNFTRSFEENPGFQYLTAWMEFHHGDLPLKRKIQDKLGISTQCRPKIQFNVTNSNDSDENDVSLPQSGPKNVTGYTALSKNHNSYHNIDFYSASQPLRDENETVVSQGLVLDCLKSNKYFLEIDSIFDVGATLDFTVYNSTTQMCLSQLRPETSTCEKENKFELHHNQTFYMAQPSPGIWFLDLKPLNCSENDEIPLNITIAGCVNDCGAKEGRGTCQAYYTNGGVLMSTCNCKAGYQGIACSNSVDAMSLEYQLLELLLLTLSNLFFLPAILISIHRRYWQEAIVFSIAMCSSTVYHACDQFSTQKYYCLADYDTLQFADFLAATAAMWVTVLAVADLPQRWAAVMQNTGVFMFAVAAHYDRFSPWLFAAPIVVGMSILLCHWIYQCRVRRDCYPPKSAWVCHLLPGLLFAAGGFLTKIIFEFEGQDGNYFWTHTLWHAFLGLSCAFLLPDITYDATKMYNPDSNNLISYYKSFDEPNFEPNQL